MTLIGLGKVRFSPSKRDSGRPTLMAWFCSGHSPPLSQTGQSSGWFTKRNSMTPSCAIRATSEDRCVRTFMPSESTCAHAGCGLGTPSISIKHARQAATGARSGWSQKRGISMPICSAARITRVPLGTSISTPSIVTFTDSTVLGVLVSGWFVIVIGHSLPRRRMKRLDQIARQRWCGLPQ